MVEKFVKNGRTYVCDGEHTISIESEFVTVNIPDLEYTSINPNCVARVRGVEWEGVAFRLSPGKEWVYVYLHDYQENCDFELFRGADEECLVRGRLRGGHPWELP